MNEQLEKRTEAADVRQTRWPGWIWAIPIAALGVAGWLGIRALVHGEPSRSPRSAWAVGSAFARWCMAARR